MSEKKHSLISPSSLYQSLACSGSVYYKLKYPGGRESPYAAEGTTAHEFGEKVLTRTIVDGDNFHEAFQDLCNEYTDIEMQSHVQNYCNEVLQLISKCKPIWIGIEQKFHLSTELDVGGTADVAFIFLSPSGQRVGVIVDLKYGQGVLVDVEGNPQLACYACALDATENLGPLDRAVVYIYQPRAEHPDGPLRQLRLGKQDLLDWKAKILIHAIDIQERLKTQTFDFCTGSHCRFCSGKAVCSEYRTDQLPAAISDFTPIVEETAPAPAELSDEALAQLVLKRAEIEQYLKAVEEHALARFREGNPVPGLKVVAGRSIRKWGDKPEVIAKALESRGVANPWKQEVIGVTEAKKQIGDAGIDDLCIRTDPPLKVVADSDPRPEAGVSEFRG